MEIIKKCDNCDCFIIISKNKISKRKEKYTGGFYRTDKYVKCPVCKKEIILYSFDEEPKQEQDVPKGCGKVFGDFNKDIAIGCGDEMDDGNIFYCKYCRNQDKGVKNGK